MPETTKVRAVNTLMDDPQTPLRKLVGANIVIGRKLLKMSQKQLAQILDMERSDLSKWETGRHQPNEENLRRIAAALNQELSFFFIDHNGEEAA